MSFSGFVTVEVLSFVLFYFFSGKARLHTCVLDRNKKSTNIAFVFLWLLCILFGVFIYAGIFKPAATYPFETLYNKNAYEQQFDAFLKHRLSIDIEPAKELLALSNPYDRASRTGIRKTNAISITVHLLRWGNYIQKETTSERKRSVS